MSEHRPDAPIADAIPDTVVDPARLHEQPFDELAVTLSGGGYRAAAFHLGVLDMLHRLGLLQSVRVLSTVSGGTLTGMKYALSVVEGVGFEDFYKGFRDFLTDNNVIGDALGDFQDQPGTPFEGQMPSLIRGAASVYASPALFGDKRLEVLLDNETSHLKEVSFNATEFSTGNYFRMQRSESAAADIGNENFSVKREVARMMRLADIAAASSCFPGAFEPIRFPDDFLWPKNLEEVRNDLGPRFKSCVALMDGGIYDNQGVDSVLTTYRRKGNKIGLVIISDTNQRSPVSDTGAPASPSDARKPQRDPLFDFKPERRRGHLKLGTINKLAWVAFILAVLSFVALLVAGWRSALAHAAAPGGYRSGDMFLDFLLYGFPLLLSAVVAAGLFWLRRRAEEGQKSVAELTTIELWPYARTLTASELIYLIGGRAKSSLALTSSVFMKRVRDLIYRDVNVYALYEGRQFSNLIYDLDDTGKFRDEVVEKLKPEELSGLAREAEGVATALWLKGPEDLKNLIACGQATTCFNLMRYILESRAAQLATPGSREAEIYALADPLWQQLRANRYALLR
ncbi:MAG TPA: patatin-like phospholipase family protein [Pyrinomonadaceae bacterium]|nr:patatin-like phospholipase family protein [Pyrinomonadaceae bacterium]